MAAGADPDPITTIKSVRPRLFPTPATQACYFLTGSLAGSCTVPIEIFNQRPSSIVNFLRTSSPAALVYRAGFRFWTFNQVKHQLESHHTPLPVWTIGALGGAAGGFVETCAQSAFNDKLPKPLALGNQSLKLFVCFGTYIFLSTNLSQELPPKPFWRCWIMGAVAGGAGSGIVAAMEGLRGKSLWLSTVSRGAVTIGTVISVQVTSCAWLLQRVKEDGYAI